ncbi:MAG: type VII secretion protein EccB, partial [Candidatus Phosphoribacter baldrii]
MAAQRSTKVQVQAYRFGVRRVEHAVQSGVAYRQSLHGPRHGLAMVIGLVVSGLVLAGFAVYGFIKPAPSIRDAKVLVDTDSGSAYVIRDGVAYPALNLASAMLAADQDSTGANSVRQVNTATLADLPRGQLLGIPGAPHQVPAEASLARNTWTVCDVITRDPAAAPGMTVLPKTTVTIGLTATRPATDATTVLATPDGRSYFLIFQGRRARVEDPANAVLTEGLGLDLAAARRISVGLLNAIPEVAPLRIPTIPSMGAATKVGGRTMRVGDVVTVERASGGTVHVVVFADGAQEVTPAVADLVRVASGQTAAPVAISPSELASLGPTA